ncbi:ABC transporter ATP-binding protein [Nonomuraea sp. KC401]|uniref:ABC transporter ATP-binding protein n=1 Tax=unclassified Nonomuraea TaxID=2593643 RepID=UPI0010FF18C3|nr:MULTISPECIES: ABC transporter ATP-binding protein [unclassified Nonomuraea]NBE97749.1 ATP-binding cassette domain-containing protein [Nonomuraea sp. K271]TLF63186.1 ABC transporter ATP-binding protein [Nonomuraea sp. KC401]
MSKVTDQVAAELDPEPAPLLQVEHLSIDLPGPARPVRVVDDVSFTVAAGRTTGLIGESGSGKTMTASAIIGLLPPGAAVTGRLLWHGDDMVTMAEQDRRRLRGRGIAMIFQDPQAALDPTQTIGRQVGEILRRGGMPAKEVRRTVIDLLDRVGIPDPETRHAQYPHQYSGGLRQRAMVATALAGSPELILADEPTTALDVTVQARILALLRRVRDEEDTAMLLVSHDLRVMAHVADEVVVMYAGRICEVGGGREVLNSPAHPYTRALVVSVPAVRSRTAIAEPLPGSPASPAERPSGCPFHPRCAKAQDRCASEVPRMRRVAAGRQVACHFPEET